jgi:hypothetical protein
MRSSLEHATVGRAWSRAGVNASPVVGRAVALRVARDHAPVGSQAASRAAKRRR